jgi:hypothetical protein
LLKNSEKQIPHRLKPVRDDKNKGLRREPEGSLYPNGALPGVFQQTVKPDSMNAAYGTAEAVPLQGAGRTTLTVKRL